MIYALPRRHRRQQSILHTPVMARGLASRLPPLYISLSSGPGLYDPSFRAARCETCCRDRVVACCCGCADDMDNDGGGGSNHNGGGGDDGGSGGGCSYRTPGPSMFARRDLLAC